MYGGDGFWMFADPADPDYIYAEAQGGDIGRINRKTHETRDIQPLRRLQGEAALQLEHADPPVAQREGHALPRRAVPLPLARPRPDLGAHLARPDDATTRRSRSRSSRAASPSTTPRPRCTRRSTPISRVAEGPQRRSGSAPTTATCSSRATAARPGRTSTANIAGLPKNAWVSSIEAGHFDAGTAYVTFDRHTFGDMEPYVYQTDDYGKTLDAARRAQEPGPARLRARGQGGPGQAATCSSSAPSSGCGSRSTAARRWAQFKGGDFPTRRRARPRHPPARPRPRHRHARPRHLDRRRHHAAARADRRTRSRRTPPSSPRAPVQQRISGRGGWREGRREFVGDNPPTAAVITYYQRTRHIFGDLKLEVLDPQGKVVDTLPRQQAARPQPRRRGRCA